MPATSTEKRKNKPLGGKGIFLTMKSQSSMNTGENGLKSPTGAVLSQDRQDGEDTEDDDDEDRSEQATVTVADLCSASHEFEWLSPNSQGPLYSHNEKQGEKGVYSELSSDPPQGTSADDQGLPSCQVSPARSVHSRHNKPPPHVWPRRPDMMDHIRMSPNPYSELHGCRRHLSPMRSSWCCPSPPPHPVCVHHGGSMLSGMEIVPYNYDYYGNEMPYLSYHNCSCLPPTGLSHAGHHHESHSWCRNTSPHHEIIRRESSSPCAMHRSCQGLGRRSRSSSSRKRDCSPSALSPRYSPVPQDAGSNARHSGQEQWQIPISTEEANSLQKLHNLESDKKNLILHASVLADQVEAQGEKINELERLLDQKKEELLRLEQNLHQEVLARSSAENSKLELMTELSNLRLRLTAVERDRKESDEKCRKLESELLSLQARLIDHEAEHSFLKGKLSHNGSYILNTNEGSEIEKLRSVLDSVTISNDEKDQKIEDLRSSLTKYKKLQDIVMSNHSKITDATPQKPSVLDTESVLSSLNSDVVKRSLIDTNTMKKAQNVPSADNISPTSYQFNKSVQLHSSPKVSPNSATTASPFQKSNSVENISHPSVGIVPNSQYGTMPRQTSSQVLQQLQGQFREHMVDSNSKNSTVGANVHRNDSSKEYSKVNRSAIGSGGKSSGVSFGKGFFKLRSGKRSSSEPYLGDGFGLNLMWLFACK